MDANQGASKPARPHHTDDEDEDEEDTDAAADASARPADAVARIARVMVSRSRGAVTQNTTNIEMNIDTII